MVQVSGRGTAYLDEVAFYTTKDERGHGAMSAVTFEQPLFAVDALRAMAEAGSPRAHLHHIIGGYPCGAMNARCETRDLGRAYEFWNGMYGQDVLALRVNSRRSPTHPQATLGHGFHALAPDREDIPMLSALATRSGQSAVSASGEPNVRPHGFRRCGAGAEPASGTRTCAP